MRDDGQQAEISRQAHEEEEEPEWHPPRHWQRFYLGYEGRFVDDCVLELQGTC